MKKPTYTPEQIRAIAHLLRLHPRTVRAIELHLFEGATQKEAGQTCGIPQANISRALRRTLTAARKIDDAWAPKKDEKGA